MWPLLLNGLNKLIKQNLHLELIRCIHFENWRDPGDQGFVLSFFLTLQMEKIVMLHSQEDGLMTLGDVSD